MKHQRIIEKGKEREVKNKLSTIENIIDIDKYEILNICNGTNYWLSLCFYENVENVEYKYHLCIDFSKFQIEYFSNSYFELEEKIFKYSFIVQNENNKDYFEDIRMALFEIAQK